MIFETRASNGVGVTNSAATVYMVMPMRGLPRGRSPVLLAAR
jgi:hypothetical protein